MGRETAFNAIFGQIVLCSFIILLMVGMDSAPVSAVEGFNIQAINRTNTMNWNKVINRSEVILKSMDFR